MVAECGLDLGGHHRLFKSHRNGDPHRRRLWTHHRRALVNPGSFTLKRGLAFTFGGLRRSLPWTVTFLVVPLVLLTAASDGLAEGFSPISAMGVFLAALMVSGGNEELGWRAVLEPELERRIPFFSRPVLPPGRFGACGICRCGSRRAPGGRRPRFLRLWPSPCSSRSGCQRSIARAGAPSPAAFSMRWRTR